MKKTKPTKWIAGAIKHPGALHRSLGVPAGKKIPLTRLEKAAAGSGLTAKRARLAMTLRGFQGGTAKVHMPARPSSATLRSMHRHMR